MHSPGNQLAHSDVKYLKTTENSMQEGIRDTSAQDVAIKRRGGLRWLRWLIAASLAVVLSGLLISVLATWMSAEGCSCYPCHKMIHGFQDCNKNERKNP